MSQTVKLFFAFSVADMESGFIWEKTKRMQVWGKAFLDLMLRKAFVFFLFSNVNTQGNVQ